MNTVDVAPFNPRKELPSHDDKSFLTMEAYLTLARRSISKFAPRYVGLHIVHQMLASDDVVSNVATDIMLGEWKWNGQGIRESYLILCAIWSIGKYVRRLKNTPQHLPLQMYLPKSPSWSIGGLSTPEFQATMHELKSIMYNVLPKEQAKYIVGYYIEGNSLVAIGKSHGISQECVRQNIKKGLKRLEKLYY